VARVEVVIGDVASPNPGVRQLPGGWRSKARTWGAMPSMSTPGPRARCSG